MKQRQLSLYIATFPYGGNGGVSSEHPDVRDWLIDVMLETERDPRIHDCWTGNFSDTPITMTRNQAVAAARAKGADVLMMVDSDMAPDLYVGKIPDAQPFFKSSFDYLYDHWEKGPVVIGAPYCGPPPHPTEGGASVVYVFQWANIGRQEPGEETDFRMEKYTREQAAVQTGIQEVGALPTGLILFDLRIYDHMREPYFYYSYEQEGSNCPTCRHPRTPGPQRKKTGTEDVTHTRDLSLVGCQKLGYNPVLCNWNAWAGHWKPVCVGKPVLQSALAINDLMRHAYQRDINYDDRQQVREITPRGPFAPLEEETVRSADPQETASNGEATRV